jgi:hypothetical protein
VAANVFLFANNASSTLAGPISPSATSVNLASGTGALFPNPSGGQQFAMTFNDAATGLLTEIVYVTEVVGDTLTIVRAQENTVAQSWLAGDLAANLITAGQMAAMEQVAELSPTREVTTSGAFVMNTTDAGGGVGLNRVVAPAPSSTTLPNGAIAGDIFAIEDLASNFNAYPVTVNAPAGMTIAGAAEIVLNVNKQCTYFRYYGSNIWSVKV